MAQEEPAGICGSVNCSVMAGPHSKLDLQQASTDGYCDSVRSVVGPKFSTRFLM
jgi:hypothetical protein